MIWDFQTTSHTPTRIRFHSAVGVLFGDDERRIANLCCLDALYLGRIEQRMVSPLYTIGIWLVLILGMPGKVEAFETRDLETLYATGMCQSCNLIRANLIGTNLSYADLNKVSLIGADLSKANLKGANLSWAILKSTSLRGSDLSDGKLIKVNLQNADLSGANLRNSDLSGAYLRESNLTNADLSQAKFTDAITTNAVFCLTTMPDGSINNSDC